MKSMIVLRDKLLNWLTESPRLCLLGWLLFTVAAGTGLYKLRFDFSPESVYSGQDEAVEFCEAHKRLFRFEDSQCLVVLESTDSRDLLRPDCLRWISDFGNGAKGVSGVTGVTSLVTLERPQLTDADSSGPTAGSIEWVPVISARDLVSESRLEDRLQRLPLLNDLLISADRRLLLVLVSLDPSGRQMETVRPRVEAIEQLLEEIPAPAGTRALLTGVPQIRVDIIRSLQNDQKLMVPLCTTAFVLLALLMFRSVQITAVSLFAVGSSVLITVGLMGWTGQTFNLLSNVVPPLSLIIAAANSVHIVSRLQVVLGTSNMPVASAVRSIMAEMTVTCFLTLATTAVGFGSLWLAKSELLQTLATQAVIAMISNYFSLIIVLGSGLTLTGSRLARKEHSEEKHSPRTLRISGYRFWSLYGLILVRHRTSIVCLHALLCIACLWWSRDMRVNAFMFETYDEHHPAMQTIQLLDRQLSGLVSLEINLEAPSRQDFFRQDAVLAVQRIRTALKNDQRITFLRDYVQILEAIDGRVASTNSQEAGDAGARIGRMIERLDMSRLTRDFIAADQPRARIMMRVHDLGSAELQELIDHVTLIANRELPSDIRAVPTGDAFLHTLCMDVFVRDLFVSLVAASGIIFLLIGIAFRSLRLGIISALPNLMPLITTVAWMKLRGFELTAGNVIVFSISLGIAVDDTIHFLSLYLSERKIGYTRNVAVHRSVIRCGRAIVMTSVLIVGGLSLLGFSDFVPTRRFAELTSITMAAALPGDLILLPALLACFDLKRRSE